MLPFRVCAVHDGGMRGQMRKQEFLEILRRALNGNMAAASVEDNIRYYDSYFTGEEAKGRSEEEILNELGDARILARSLIDAAERAGDVYAQEANETQYRAAGSRGQDSYGNPGYEQDNGPARPAHMRIPGWLVLLFVLLIVVVAIRIVGVLIWFVLPYVLPILLAIYLIRLIQRR